MKQQNPYFKSLAVLITLFFMWGFITCMNDILIPFLKKMFDLSRTESMLVQFAFFSAYFIGSLVYFRISVKKGDPINKIGYKNGILIGLIVSGIGSLLFYPAAEYKSFVLFLSALFIVGIGFTLLQIAANPYVAILGSTNTASSRLNLSQAFNSFGTTIAPIVGGYLVFHYFAKIGNPLLNEVGNPILTDSGQSISALGIQLPYLIFGLLFFLLALLIKFVKLPRFTNEIEIEKSAGALKYPHLVLGMVAIFMYVGAEVSIGSCLINYIGEMTKMPEMKAKTFLAFYWGGAMIGRFLGAISLSDMKNQLKKYGLMLITAIGAYAIIYLAVFIENPSEISFSQFLPYLGFMALNFVAFYFGRSKAGRTLFIFALINIALLIISMATSGMMAVWFIVAIGLFNSIMWSNIFTLAIKDLGKFTSQGSSLLVMMILGGALLPLLQGYIADKLHGYHYSFFIPALAFAYLAFYGLKGYKIKN